MGAPGSRRGGGRAPKVHPVMQIKPYIPSLQQISKEALAVIAATVIAAFVISRIPSLKAFVRENSVN